MPPAGFEPAFPPREGGVLGRARRWGHVLNLIQILYKNSCG